MTLSQACQSYQWDPTLAMNLLQDWGIVSDLCVITNEVAPQDCDLAIRFCKLNTQDIKAEKDFEG